jgi:oligopeptide/dipeptide ABC transporter ATP-binding protein
MSSARPALVEVRELEKHFPIRRGMLRREVGAVRAVDGVTFDIREGETLGLVGESGSGKSTLGRALLRLLEPTSGSVAFDGEELTTMDPSTVRLRRRDMQMVFQDPYSSLNPRIPVGRIVREPLDIHGIEEPSRRSRRVDELLERVGLDTGTRDRFPHELSGGQRQRIGIARALATNPRFIVADEPISALDVSIQAQIVNLLLDLRSELGLTYLFIAHDLAMVRHISDRVAVMYLGRIVELGPAGEIFARPLHPYTRALLSAMPIPDPAAERKRVRIPLTGDIPSPAHPPAGCRFHPRCPLATEICRSEDPEVRSLPASLDRAGEADPHRVACHHATPYTRSS